MGAFNRIRFFLETIKAVRRIANCLAKGDSGLAVMLPYCGSAFDLQMDKMFFEWLLADWHKAPNHFMALFEGLDAETLVAFLAGRPAFVQRLKVAMQLAKLNFLRTAGRHALIEVS